MKLDVEIEITENAMQYIRRDEKEPNSIVISYNEILNWCASRGEWISVSLHKMSDYDQERYLKITAQNINIYLEYDAYFMMSGIPKLTLDLTDTPYGNYLIIRELNPA